MGKDDFEWTEVRCEVGASVEWILSGLFWEWSLIFKVISPFWVKWYKGCRVLGKASRVREASIDWQKTNRRQTTKRIIDDLIYIIMKFKI